MIEMHYLFHNSLDVENEIERGERETSNAPCAICSGAMLMHMATSS